MLLNHIGIIVKDIEKSKLLYKRLGYSVVVDMIDMLQNNRIAIMKSSDSVNIELIEPMNEKSSVINAKKGYHHICYEAEPCEDIINKFKQIGIGKIFTKPTIAPALNNHAVVFACLQDGTFIEFIME